MQDLINSFLGFLGRAQHPDVAAFTDQIQPEPRVQAPSALYDSQIGRLSSSHGRMYAAQYMWNRQYQAHLSRQQRIQQSARRPAPTNRLIDPSLRLTGTERGF